jgi:3-oxoacyl-[acyl-carrier protein] reductase
MINGWIRRGHPAAETTRLALEISQASCRIAGLSARNRSCFTAQELVAEGAQVVITGLTPSDTARAAEGLGGVDRAIKALSDELGPRGIRVNGLMPAWVSTSRAVELSAAGHDKPLNSLRRRGSAEEFGRVATFLLSPAASYLTGAMIAVDGGALPTI